MVGEARGQWQAAPAGARPAEAASPRANADPLLTIEGLSKRFPGVVANEAVTLKVARQQIHALVGENGAGKSTLVKLIYGLLRPDAGAMSLAGEPYQPHSPAEARAKGVGMVFQHFSLFEGLTVAENIALGMEGQRADKGLRQRIAGLSSAYGLKLDPARQVGFLSVGERQRVEIVRCLLGSPRLIIMDEPTSVLTPQEVEALFAILRRLVREGCSILYISHKLEEIKSLCQRATILRAGRLVAELDPRQESIEGMAAMMLGGALPGLRRLPEPVVGPTRLRVSGLNLGKQQQFGVDLSAINFAVRGGEILGIAGIAGNGQRELLAALTGERLAATAGSIEIDGIGVGRASPAQRRALGLCSVPEERLAEASVADMRLWENALLTAHARLPVQRRGLIDRTRLRAFARRVVDEFAVNPRGSETRAGRLSGGNLQKFLVGREVLQTPGVLVVAQPSWGVDVGSAVTIHQRLIAEARAGAAVLVISQDLDELFAIADRIAVLAHGRLSPPRPVAALTAAGLGLGMAGRAPSAEAAHA